MQETGSVFINAKDFIHFIFYPKGHLDISYVFMFIFA
jgi:hypothetical protein